MLFFKHVFFFFFHIIQVFSPWLWIPKSINDKMVDFFLLELFRDTSHQFKKLKMSPYLEFFNQIMGPINPVYVVLLLFVVVFVYIRLKTYRTYYIY